MAPKYMLKLESPLILASSSPRRKEILEMTDIAFEVIPSLFEEPRHSDHLTEPEVFAQEVSYGKGEEVFDRFEQKRMVLSADTIGILEDLVLEKPTDRADAKRMLSLMSGKTHTVITAVTLFVPQKEEALKKIVSTAVTFRKLDEEEIEYYLDQGEYADKAAAYAIQGKAAVFVEHIEGEYLNIVGLPLTSVWGMLKRALK